MKEIVNLKSSRSGLYLGFVLATENEITGDLEVTENEFLKFAERARKITAWQIKPADLIAEREIVIVRNNKNANCLIIEEGLHFVGHYSRFVNCFWKGIKYAEVSY